VVKQIMAFSRKTPMAKQPMPLQPIIKEAMNLLRATIPSTITIHQDIDPNCGQILANPVQIHQVLMNLCTNASHAMAKNGGELFVSLRPTVLTDQQRAQTLLDPGRYLLLTIRDTGSGMPPEVLARIFEPFFTTKGLGSGTGMGLAVVHGIIKECRGSILVNSHEGQGSSFQIFLPILADADQQSTGSTDTPDALAPLTGSGRILFADDEEQLRELAKMMLEELGYKITLAVNGMDAWQIFTADPTAFDLVITDKTMPEINGLVLAGKIRSVRADLPIILCSGDQTGIIPAMLGSVGIMKFLTKPFVIEELARAAHEALNPQEVNKQS
jgi:CheY-like chemotaxis protein